MISSIPPSLILVLGGLLVPFFRGRSKPLYLLLLPAAAFVSVLYLPQGKSCIVAFLDYDLILARTDRLSLVFGYIFTIITFIGALFALKVKDDVQHVSAFTYAGGALGVTFAGDWLRCTNCPS